MELLKKMEGWSMGHSDVGIRGVAGRQHQGGVRGIRLEEAGELLVVVAL